MTTLNHFEQASRFAAQLDPAGFLRWLLGPAAERYRFCGWLDTHTLSLEDQTEHPGDLVAELVEKSVVALGWAVPIAIRVEPDRELFGLLLELLGRLWQKLHPTEQPSRHFQVAAAVLNLTGSGRTSRVMHLGEGLRISMEVRENNLAEKEAVLLLDAMAEGKHTRALLPFVPLLRGGSEESILERWKTVAAQEPDAQRRRDYACLAVVLADLVDAGTVWEKVLEGEDMKQSVHVLAWQNEARQKAAQETKAACVIDLLEGRFGKKVPATVANQIKATEDITQLDALFRAAITAGTLAEFRKLLKAE